MKNFVEEVRGMDNWNAGVPFKRTNHFPLDPSSVLRLSELQDYLKGKLSGYEGTAYPGQVICVVDDDTGEASYMGLVESDNKLETVPIGSVSGMNFVQKAVISTPGSGQYAGKFFAYKEAFSENGTKTFKTKNRTPYLESDTIYEIDLSNEKVVIALKDKKSYCLDVDVSKVYRGIRSDFAYPMKIHPLKSGTFNLSNSRCLFAVAGADQDADFNNKSTVFPNLQAFDSLVIFKSDMFTGGYIPQVQNFWKEKKHSYYFSTAWYDYSTFEGVTAGELEITSSTVHLNGKMSLCPTLTGTHPSGSIYLHKSSRIKIGDDVKIADVDIYICPENYSPNPVIGTLKPGIRIHWSRPCHFVIGGEDNVEFPWEEDDELECYKYTIKGSDHMRGLTTTDGIFVSYSPSVSTFTRESSPELGTIWDKTFDSYTINNRTGDITVYVDSPEEYLVVIDD